MSAAFRQIVRRLWLFSELDEAALDQVMLLGKQRRFGPRETVVHQGDRSGDLFVVLRGRLKASSANVDGAEVVLSIMGEGEVFGEIALLDAEPRSATVAALEACELLVIERRSFHDLLLRTPTLALNLMRVMAKRLRDLSNRTQDVSLLDAEGRLAKAILALAERFGETAPGGRITVELRLSQQELASMIGATRELVNKRLRSWAEAGIIELQGQRLVINDADALERGRAV